MRKIIPLFVKRYDPVYNYNIDVAEKIKQKIDIPVIAVGGIRNINDINSIISEKKADYVSMCRPFIIEPDIVKKFKEGKQDNSKCIDCCYCLFGAEKSSQVLLWKGESINNYGVFCRLEFGGIRIDKKSKFAKKRRCEYRQEGNVIYLN